MSYINNEVINIGSRVEMFIDKYIIAKMDNTTLKLNTPVKKEIVMQFDKPWEGATGAYFTVLKDDGLIKLYYRGDCPDIDTNPQQITCYAVSTDGINFTRPALNLYDYFGLDNNIIWKGIESHNLTPFKDDRPCVLLEHKYKAVGGATPPGKSNGQLYALSSNDGVVWKRLMESPILEKGTFDSQNVVFWDTNIKKYRCYSRYFDKGGFSGVRAIQSCTSDNFINWSDMVENSYEEDVPKEQFYTNATVLCPGAEHIYLSFPKRFVPERKKIIEHPVEGVSDAVIMTSRDGVNWDRTFMEAWCRPGCDYKNWTDRSNMPALGIVETSPTEFSMYISEHFRHDDNRLRRLAIRKHGFASVNAGYKAGMFTTKPVIFSGNKLSLNYSTSAAGHIRVGMKDISGKPIQGFTLEDMNPLYGDSVYENVYWNGGKDLSKISGCPVMLDFEMKDADIYSLHFGN